MNDSTLKYATYELEVIYFEDKAPFTNCAISGQEGSGSGTYSWDPVRSDS